MKLKASIAVLAIIGFTLAGCDRSSATDGDSITGIAGSNSPALRPAEFMAWCKNPESGLAKSKEIGDITFSLQYKPLPYIVCTEQKTENITDDVLKTQTQELDALEYFDFKISLTESMGELIKYNLSSAEEYNARVNYLAFGIQDDLKLLSGKDTLTCELLHFERAYDVAPYATLLCAFPKSSNKEKTFLYEDRLFGKGIIKFTFRQEEINNIPQLKTL